MRVIGGKWKSRKINGHFKISHNKVIRPTSDRVKENIFNILENLDIGNPIFGAKAVTSIRLFSKCSEIRASFAFIPFTQFFANDLEASPSNSSACNMLLAIIGLKTFNSKCP